MSSSTEPPVTTLFRFLILNTPEPKIIDHAHPMPSFLCHPTAAKFASSEYQKDLTDVIALIAAQHADECTAAVTSPCRTCGEKATDAVKAPRNFLHLDQPMMVIRVAPVCGKRGCQEHGKMQLVHEMQEQMNQTLREQVFLDMKCAVCGKKDAKRCAGCAEVAYCSRECQKVGWSEHKGYCHRGYKPGKEVKGVEGKLPFETI